MQIDAPIETERGNFFSGAQTEAGDDTALDDDAIIDSKALYKNFIELVKGQKLNIIQASQVKRDGMTSQINKDEI